MTMLGRPIRELTKEEYAIVQRASGLMGKDQIAWLLNMSPNTLREIEGRDNGKLSELLNKGRSDRYLEVTENLIRHTKRSTEACKFYLKAQAGWREDDIPDMSQTPVTINIIKPDGAD
jgi:hypothetical protein